MSTPDQVRAIAKRRLEEIEYSTQRILRKMESNPTRRADYEKRLAEYDVSKVALALELKSGVSVRIKDQKQQALLASIGLADVASVPPPSAGVTVNVPAGNMTLEGKK